MRSISLTVPLFSLLLLGLNSIHAGDFTFHGPDAPIYALIREKDPADFSFYQIMPASHGLRKKTAPMRLYWSGETKGGPPFKPALGITCGQLKGPQVLKRHSQEVPHFLASRATGLRPHPNRRATPNDHARTLIIIRARLEFQKYGLSAEKVEVHSLVQTELSPGRQALMGTLNTSQAGQTHSLFLVVEVKGNRTKAILSNYKGWNDTEIFFDQLDIEGDRMDEIVTTSETHPGTFNIYKREGTQYIFIGSSAPCANKSS